MRSAAPIAAILLAQGLVACGQVLEHVRFKDLPTHQDRCGRAEAYTFRLPRAAAPPEIDGELADQCWQEPAAYLGRFRLGLSPTPARHAREAWATYDDRYLYLAAKLQREPGTEPRAEVEAPDDPLVWKDDEIEVFLDPFGTGAEYFQLIVNCRGVLYDAQHSWSVVPDPRGVGPGDTMLKRQTDVRWSSGLRRETRVRRDRWVAELAVPLASLGLSGAPAGHAVNFNLTSADWDTGEYTCLCPCSDWHDPQQFGVLLLGERRLEVQELALAPVGLGRNALRARVRDLSGEAGEYALRLTFVSGRDKAEAEREFRLAAGGRSSLGLAFETSETAQAWRAGVAIYDRTGRAVFTTRRTGTIPPPLTVGLGSRAAFQDGPPVAVAARVGLGSVTARHVTLAAELLDSRGRSVATQGLGVPKGTHIAAQLPVGGLSPGAYRLKLTAAHEGRIVAEAEDRLLVGPSPFAER